MCVLKYDILHSKLNLQTVNELSKKSNQWTKNYFNALWVFFAIHLNSPLSASVWSYRRDGCLSTSCSRSNIFLTFFWHTSSHRCQLSQRYTSTARWDWVRPEIESQCLELLSTPDSRVQWRESLQYTLLLGEKKIKHTTAANSNNCSATIFLPKQKLQMQLKTCQLYTCLLTY